MKGFSTNTPKMVENKFVVGEPTPELLDDWDQRRVESILEFHEAVEAHASLAVSCNPYL